MRQHHNLTDAYLHAAHLLHCCQRTVRIKPGHGVIDDEDLLASCGSWSSDAKKKASASVLRLSALKVLRNAGPALAVSATCTLFMTTL